MNDRELLELAAKAAGIAIRPGYSFQSGMFFVDAPNPDGKVTGLRWNPITDDGDALRLACYLGLRVFPVARTQSGAACSAVGSVTGERLSEVVDFSLDTRAATRLAIVRAAAEIGKEMK